MSGSKDNEARVWDARGGACLGVGAGHVGAVGALALVSGWAGAGGSGMVWPGAR